MLRLSAIVDWLFPNRTSQQRLAKLIVIKTERKTHKGLEFDVIFFMCRDHPDVEFFCAKNKAKIIKKGPADQFFTVPNQHDAALPTASESSVRMNVDRGRPIDISSYLPS
jgi:hypothetical protein